MACKLSSSLTGTNGSSLSPVLKPTFHRRCICRRDGCGSDQSAWRSQHPQIGNFSLDTDVMDLRWDSLFSHMVLEVDAREIILMFTELSKPSSGSRKRQAEAGRRQMSVNAGQTEQKKRWGFLFHPLLHWNYFLRPATSRDSRSKRMTMLTKLAGKLMIWRESDEEFRIRLMVWRL